MNKIKLTADESHVEKRLRRHVDILAEVIGERHLEKYSSLLAAEKYVTDQLISTGLPVSYQSYTVLGKTVKNIVAEQKGLKYPDEIIVVGAHYDSIDGTPGADDNASAVAGLLEIAQQLSKHRFKRTIRYVSFVNEEPPHYKGLTMGSYRYAKMCRENNDDIVGMVNLEMLGYYDDAIGSQAYPGLGKLEKFLPSRANYVVICSNMKSWRFLSKVAWGFRRSIRFPMIPFPAPTSVEGPGMSDNWSFWQFDYPAVMVTDTSFLRNRHYHQATDRLSTLHLPATTKVVMGVAGAITRLGRKMK